MLGYNPTPPLCPIPVPLLWLLTGITTTFLQGAQAQAQNEKSHKTYSIGLFSVPRWLGPVVYAAVAEKHREEERARDIPACLASLGLMQRM